MIYTGEHLREISFPLGGIGTGSVGLAGNGHLMDWEIFNRPSKGSENGYTFMAIRSETADGKVDARVLQGDAMKEYSGRYAEGETGFGCGLAGYTMAAFPHFSDVTFDGRFPIASLEMNNRSFPAKMQIRAFNPFIPLDSKASSIPCAMFFVDTEATEDAKFTLIFSLSSPFERSHNMARELPGARAAFIKSVGPGEDSPAYGDMTVCCGDKDAFVQEYWYRGGWRDGIATFWREFETDNYTERHYDTPAKKDVATVGIRFSLKKGEKKTVPFILTWNIPNQYNYWNPVKDSEGKDITWRNYYATRFADSMTSAAYCAEHCAELYDRTARFRDMLFSSSLPDVYLDAISSALSVLKSATVLRLEDGSFYGWEGCNESTGSCEGTCTHVWTYAYVLCFLFPDLEQSLRDNEIKYDVYPSGAMRFRMPLPVGRESPFWRACVDGQMGTVFKIYREWKLTRDNTYLTEKWGTVKKLLGYAWSEENPDAWDRDRDGILEGRQHHTLDMEMFGPSSWLESMYLTALEAAIEMAREMGEDDTAEDYGTLLANGRAFLNDRLFNGKWFCQSIDIRDLSPARKFGCPDYINEEAGELKYQIAGGCEIDQLLGEWHARILGLPPVVDRDKAVTALRSIYKNNHVPSFRDYANPWRLFGLNDESGTVICTYPEGAEKPVIPIPYCEESMHGFEYALAGLMLSYGLEEEAYQVVKSVRDRYNGANRNPWNEIECGSNYARSMANFALLPIMSGYEFDMPHGRIGFDPKTSGDSRFFFSCGTAWGAFEKKGNTVSVSIERGEAVLCSIRLPFVKGAVSVAVDGREVSFEEKDGLFTFDRATIKHGLVIRAESVGQ